MHGRRLNTRHNRTWDAVVHDVEVEEAASGEVLLDLQAHCGCAAPRDPAHQVLAEAGLQQAHVLFADGGCMLESIAGSIRKISEATNTGTARALQVTERMQLMCVSATVCLIAIAHAERSGTKRKYRPAPTCSPAVVARSCSYTPGTAQCSVMPPVLSSSSRTLTMPPPPLPFLNPCNGELAASDRLLGLTNARSQGRAGTHNTAREVLTQATLAATTPCMPTCADEARAEYRACSSMVRASRRSDAAGGPGGSVTSSRASVSATET